MGLFLCLCGVSTCMHWMIHSFGPWECGNNEDLAARCNLYLANSTTRGVVRSRKNKQTKKAWLPFNFICFPEYKLSQSRQRMVNCCVINITSFSRVNELHGLHLSNNSNASFLGKGVYARSDVVSVKIWERKEAKANPLRESLRQMDDEAFWSTALWIHVQNGNRELQATLVKWTCPDFSYHGHYHISF